MGLYKDCSPFLTVGLSATFYLPYHAEILCSKGTKVIWKTERSSLVELDNLMLYEGSL
jgi:hypothetical protein